MFKKILVCLDGSETAERIIPFVRDEAIAHKGQIILLRVITPPANLTLGVPGFPAIPFHTSSMPEQLKKEYDTASAYLDRIAQRLKRQGIQVKSEIMLGSPGPAIISYIKDTGIDLVAIASHGHSGLRNVLLGSTAEHILRESDKPILMTRPK